MTDALTSLVYMSMYEWQQPWTIDASGGRILERCSDHMEIPNVSIIEGPFSATKTLGLGEVILKRRCDIV
jgi:hypothetical protein